MEQKSSSGSLVVKITILAIGLIAGGAIVFYTQQPKFPPHHDSKTLKVELEEGTHIVFSHPKKAAENNLLNLILNATEKIDILAFYLENTNLADALIKVAKKGVDVRMVTLKENIDKPYSQVKRLHERVKINILDPQKGFFETLAMKTDSEYTIILIDNNVCIRDKQGMTFNGSKGDLIIYHGEGGDFDYNQKVFNHYWEKIVLADKEKAKMLQRAKSMMAEGERLETIKLCTGISDAEIHELKMENKKILQKFLDEAEGYVAYHTNKFYYKTMDKSVIQAMPKSIWGRKAFAISYTNEQRNFEVHLAKNAVDLLADYISDDQEVVDIQDWIVKTKQAIQEFGRLPSEDEAPALYMAQMHMKKAQALIAQGYKRGLYLTESGFKSYWINDEDVEDISHGVYNFEYYKNGFYINFNQLARYLEWLNKK